MTLSCLLGIHYEIEFIHPFEDGNGRMGRFWQSLILKEYDEFFKYVPIESLIEENQLEYYDSLGVSDQVGESTPSNGNGMINCVTPFILATNILESYLFSLDKHVHLTKIKNIEESWNSLPIFMN